MYAPERSGQSGERRQATILFSDLSGYTAMNERLDPEEVQGFMSRFKAEAVEIVESHGGIVNQFVGDEVMALFGVPVAHEDDPVRAVRSALSLHALARRIGGEMEGSVGAPVRMHTGATTGLVVFQPRDDRDGLYGVTGDSVNTAARLADLAESDEILLSPETSRLVAPFFATEALDATSMRGKSHPIVPYRVTGELSVESRFEAEEAGGYTPFIGRIGELDALNACWEKTIAGRGQFVTVAGEAGAGKSRLLYEFRHRLSRDRITVLQGRCQSYGADTLYLPLINALRRGLRLEPGDRTAELLSKVVTNVRAIDPELERFLPLYLHILSIGSEEFPLPKSLTGPELTGALQEALTAIITLQAKGQPMVLLLEDWHWADEASRAALRSLVESLPGHRIMLVVTHRSENTPDWGEPPHHTRIVLGPMGANDSEAVIRAVLGTPELPDGLAAHIHERTGGNAFFIEEVCGALAEAGVIARRNGRAELTEPLETLALPDTVQAVIRSRLDRLDDALRETLGLASVIGREFACDVLERIADSRANLYPSLETLRKLELIQQIGDAADATYMFKHVLTQEVAYQTLLLRRRRELHSRVGRAIEELYADRIEEQTELLAHHHSLAEDWSRAVKFGRLSAEKAQWLSQFNQAIRLYEQAAAWQLHLPKSKSQEELLVDIQQDMFWSVIGLGQFDKAAELCKAMEPIALSLGDSARLGKLYISFGIIFLFAGNAKQTEHYCLKAIEQLEASDEPASLSYARQCLASSYLSQGLWQKSSPLYAAALESFEELELQTAYLFGFFGLPYRMACAQMAYNLAVQGRIAEARELLRRGGSPALEEASNLMTKSMFTNWHCLFVSLACEDSFGAMETVAQLIQIGEKSDSPLARMTAHLSLANALMGMGDFAGVRHHCEQGLQPFGGRPIKIPHLANLYYNLARTCLEADDLGGAQQNYELGLPYVELAPYWYGPRFDFLKGMLLSRGPGQDLDQAVEICHKSISADLEGGAVVLAAQTEFHLAELLHRKGEESGARESLARLEGQFAGWDLPVWQRKCQEKLAELSN